MNLLEKLNDAAVHHSKRIFFLFSLLCFVPFINRPVFVDDHAHFQQAIERGRNLTKIYSGGVNELGWEKGRAPSEANGPGYFYLMGIFTRLFGSAEWTAHLLIFSISILGL